MQAAGPMRPTHMGGMGNHLAPHSQKKTVDVQKNHPANSPWWPWWCLILPKGFAVFSKENPQNWQDDFVKMLLNYHFWETNIETGRGFWLPKTHSKDPPS